METRLNRLLGYLDHDAGNLALRKDAVREAFDRGEWNTARELIDAGLWLHSHEPELLALSGFSHLHERNYDEAGKVLSAALAQGLDAPEVRYNLALAHFMQRRYPQAFELLQDSRIADAVTAALMLRARCAHHLGRSAEAIADCRAQLARSPDDAEAHGLLGLLLQEQWQCEAASGHIDTALKLNPKQLEALLARASLQRDSGDYEAATASFADAAAMHPDCGRAWLGLALTRLGTLQLDAAWKDIEVATARMPDHIGTWHVLAWIQLMRGDVAAAESAFRQAMALDRNFGETHGGLAVVAAVQGRDADARSSIERALRLDPRTMSARYAQMLLLQRAGKHEEAGRVIEAFLARPVSGRDIPFRTLVMSHLEAIQARSARAPHAGALH